MKILLINHNPVVSRLTSLSAKKEKVELDEIKEISELEIKEYNIVFVDSESYNDSIANMLKNSGIKKSVLFYTQGEEENKAKFDHSILKPFLPSEVSAILRDAKIESHQESSKEQQDKENLEKSVSFEELVDTKEPHLEELELVELENKTSETIEKKDNFDLKLEEAFPLHSEEESQKTTEETKELNLDTDLFELDEKKEEKSIEDNDLFELDKEIKEKIVTDEILDLDLESVEEVNFDEKIETIDTIEKEDPKIEEQSEEPKILDQTELSNIKDLLKDESELTEENLTLEDIITPSTPALIKSEASSEEKKKKKKEKKEKASNIEKTEATQNSTADVLAATLGQLPVEDLRKLLRGATVNITIQFPNEL